MLVYLKRGYFTSSPPQQVFKAANIWTLREVEVIAIRNDKELQMASGESLKACLGSVQKEVATQGRDLKPSLTSSEAQEV